VARSNTEIKSLIKPFIVKPSKDFKEYLLVFCPKEDCPSQLGEEQRPFLVHKRTFTRPLRAKGTTFITRACPYCFRPSGLPGRIRG
jgi:hypothetical protein